MVSKAGRHVGKQVDQSGPARHQGGWNTILKGQYEIMRTNNPIDFFVVKIAPVRVLFIIVMLTDWPCSMAYLLLIC